jgi:predicted transcriptional regulator
MGVSDTNIKKYTEHQVLGYWDLTLFARLKGINLTRQERAVKLFPPASHSANVDIDRDTIKYKIKPFAEKAISEGHLKRLRGQLRGG